MITRKLESPDGDGFVEAEVVEIEEIVDRPIVIKLSDGAIIRVRVDVIEVCRANDSSGKKRYHVETGTLVSVVEVGER